MRIVLRTKATDALEEILLDAASRNTNEANNIQKRVTNSLNTLTVFPKSARYNQRTKTYEKVVPHTRVLMVYTVAEETIDIITFFHTRRDPKRKLR
jgi:plasmid stabilization system protein ParE